MARRSFLSSRRDALAAIGTVAFGLSRSGVAQETEGDSETDDARKAEFAKTSGELADGTKVAFVNLPDRKIERNPKAVFHFDDQPRRILDGRLWLWSHEGRPVALQKVEFVDDGQSPWQICFASFADELLVGEWPHGRRAKTTRAGLAWTNVDDGPALPEKAAARRLAAKRFVERVSAKIQITPDESNLQAMRMLPRPIHDYEAPEQGVAVGAIFGFVTNGTNPDAYVVTEAIQKEGKPVRWRIGCARMTTGGVNVRLDENSIWTCEFLHQPDAMQGSWTFFRTPVPKR